MLLRPPRRIAALAVGPQWGQSPQTAARRRKRTVIVAHHAGNSVSNVILNDERFHLVGLKLSNRQADDRLRRLQFAIIIAPGNLRPWCISGRQLGRQRKGT
jgi:hypothetical protein